MKSIIASLRSLTLPFGATSGPRIVLNGVLGRIEVYSDLGNLMITIDDDGLQVYDATGMVRTRIAIPGLFSTISFFSSSGNAAVIAAQAPGADYELWTIQAINGSKGFGRLLFLSPTNTTKNPLLQWDTGFLTSDVAQPIVDFTGFTGGRTAVVAVDDIRHATNNGGANAPTLGPSYPRGSLGKIEDTANSAAITAEATVLGDLSSIPVITGRRYKVTYYARTLNQSVALDEFDIRIKRDAGAGFGVIGDAKIQYGTGGENAGGVLVQAMYEPASTATVAFRVTAERTAGTGNLILGATASSPMYLLVEDIGQAN